MTHRPGKHRVNLTSFNRNNPLSGLPSTGTYKYAGASPQPLQGTVEALWPTSLAFRQDWREYQARNVAAEAAYTAVLEELELAAEAA